MCVLRGLSTISLFGINTSYSSWNVFSAPGTTGTQYSLYLGEVEEQLAQTVEIKDRFLVQARPLVNSLYKSIPADRALQLLNDGASQTSAVITSITEYLDSIASAPAGSMPQAASTHELTINDPAGNATTFDLTNYNNNIVTLNAGNNNDIIDLGGENNFITLTGGTGNDTINIDDSSANVFFVTGSTGTDTLNIAGDLVDYSFLDNGDGTLTMTNNSTGTEVTINNSFESINFGDGSTLAYNGTTVTINSVVEQSHLIIDKDNTTYNLTTASGNEVLELTGDLNILTVDMNAGDDNFIISGDQNNVTVDMGAGNDLLQIGGSNNTVSVQTYDKQDIIFVEAGNNNVITVDGGNYTDTVRLEGIDTDWILAGNTYTHNTTGTSVTISNVENVLFGQLTTDADGNASTFDLTAYLDTTEILHTGDMNDTVNLGGTNNNIELYLDSGDNIVNIDTTNYNNFIINGGTGTDTVNFAGNIGDYTFQNKLNGTLTVTDINSGAVTTLDSSVNNIKFADLSVLTFDEDGINIVSSNIDDTINVTGSDNNLIINTFNGNDTINVEGTNNTVSVSMANGDDNLYVAVGDNNNITVDGADGNDTLTLQGVAGDWTLTGVNPGQTYYENIYSGTKVTLQTSIENIVFDGSIVVYDNPGLSSTLDATGYNNSTILVNAGDGDDTINVDGTNNVATVDLVSGDNIVNVDDSAASAYTINGGSGTDLIYLSGNIADYSISSNLDDTIIVTNTLSGATITLDPNKIEEIHAADGLLPLEIVTINGTPGPDILDASTYNNSEIVVNALAGDDTVTVGGTDNVLTANLDDGDDVVNYDDSQINDVTVFGGAGNDTVSLTGNLPDYGFQDNGDGTMTMTNTISGATLTIDASLENINLADGTILAYDGTNLTINDALGNSNTVDTSSSSDLTLVINANNMNDTVNLGGSNNTITTNLDSGTNIVNVDDSNFNTFVVNGGTGADTVNMAGNFADYTLTDNLDGTLTFNNTTSGATTTIDAAIETVNFADAYAIAYDGANITLTGFTIGVDTTTISGTNTTFTAIDTDNGADVITIDGTNNTVNIATGLQDDSIFVMAGSNNTITLDGSSQTDTLTLEGSSGDWNLVGSTYTHNVTGTSVTISNIENVNFTI